MGIQPDEKWYGCGTRFLEVNGGTGFLGVEGGTGFLGVKGDIGFLGAKGCLKVNEGLLVTISLTSSSSCNDENDDASDREIDAGLDCGFPLPPWYFTRVP